MTAFTLLTSVVVEPGMAQHQGQLGGDAADATQPVAFDQAQRVLRPPVVHQVGRAAPAQHSGQLGHGAQVGEGCPRHRGPAAAPRVADVDVGDGLELPAGEHRALGQARGPRREDDGDRSVRVSGRRRDVGSGHSQGGQQVLLLGGPFDHGDGVPGGGQVGGGQDHGRPRPGENGRPFVRGQPAVDPGGRRSQAGRSQVGDQVLRGRGQDQGQDIAFDQPPLGQPDGDLARQPVEVGVAERPTLRGDVRRRLSPPSGGGP